MSNFPSVQQVPTRYLEDLVRDADARTMELVSDLDDKQLMGPRLTIVNPMLWEIGHIAWFYEKFILSPAKRFFSSRWSTFIKKESNRQDE